MYTTENTHPKNIQFLEFLTRDTKTRYVYVNAFNVFISINNIFYLIFGSINNSIICLYLINNTTINEIKNAHKQKIGNLKHYLDKINNRDLLLSLSNEVSTDYNILKVWNISNCECLLNIEKIYTKCKLSSASFLKDKCEYYIITCNSVVFNKNTEPTKIFDFKK